MSSQTSDGVGALTLLERCKNLNQLLDNYGQLQRKTQIRNDYMFLSKTLAEEAGKLQLHAGAYLLLLRNVHFDGGDMIVAPMAGDPVGSTRFALQNFREAFNELKFEVRQSQEQEWTKLLAEMDTLTKNFKQHIAPAWEIYVKDLCDCWYVEASLLDSQMHINERKRLFESYQADQERFDKVTKRIPRSQEELDEIHQLHKRLLDSRSQMDLNVPPAVNEFLMASGRGYGAPLDLLTPEVLDWLANNDDVSRYSIKRRG